MAYRRRVSTALTPSESEQIENLCKSLRDWALADIKRAASPEVDLPRLAFVGLAALLDRLSILYAVKGKGLNAWMQFVPRYFRYKTAEEVELLYDGLRNALLHEYGTRGVALTHGSAGDHWTIRDGLRVIDLHELLEETESAFEAFVSELRSNNDARKRVLPRAAGLLALVQLPQLSASLSHSLSLTSALSASATGPVDTQPSETPIKPWRPPRDRPKKKPH
jgi:hypothetical protein